MTSRAATLSVLPAPGTSLWEAITPAAAPAGAVREDVAWERLIARHGRRVVVALLARGVPLERAKELAQDAWLRIIEQHRAGRLAELQVPGVVIAQACFLARDDRRRGHRRAEQLADAPDETRTPCERDLERRLFARDDLRRALAVVDGAPTNARRVFALLYGEEPLPAAEIAARLGLSVQRVRQIACELRARIRRAIEEDGHHG
jgi:RNA polymerase sigma-70 factor (ECF subfamily)